MQLSWKEAGTFIGDECPTDGRWFKERKAMVTSWGGVLTQLLVYSTMEMEWN